MAVKVTNLYQKLVIKLKTNLPSNPTLYYMLSHTELITNVPTTTATPMYAVGVRDGNEITYTIQFKDFSIGDTLRSFNCKWNANHSIFTMQDGVSVLVDGVESPVIKTTGTGIPIKEDNNYVMINPLNQANFALVFKDTDVHTVQAIYKGTKNIGVALSEKAIISPQIREEHEEHPEIEGSYKIEFIKYQEEMSYLGESDWLIRLTKGNVGVRGEIIQLDTPTATWTFVTDVNGYVNLKVNKDGLERGFPSSITTHRNRWVVGDYTIRARYHYFNPTTDAFEEVICYDTRQLTVHKSTPTMEVVNYAQTKNGRAVFKLKDPFGFNLENIKLVAIVNGRTYTKTTDSQGNISFTLGVKGNVKYTFKYAGNKNYNSKEWMFSETIS